MKIFYKENKFSWITNWSYCLLFAFFLSIQITSTLSAQSNNTCETITPQPGLDRYVVTAFIYTDNGQMTAITEQDQYREIVMVDKCDDVSLKFSSNDGYTSKIVYVDGIETKVDGNTYTFSNVQNNHTLAVGFFDSINGNSYTITSHASSGGLVVPSGEVYVKEGYNAIFYAVPDIGRNVEGLIIDGVDLSSHTEGNIMFRNVNTNHEIHFAFNHEQRYAYRTIDDINLWETNDIAPENTINPNNIQYMGSFKLPQSSNGYSFGYGAPIAYNPDGNSSEGEVDYPGSLFFLEGNVKHVISEISIPAPIISEDKEENILNTAEVIRPFVKIDSGLDDTEPIVGLEYISSQSKLFFGGGRVSYGDADRPNIGWIDDTFENNAGLWHVGNMTPYQYGAWFIFEIPQIWANNYTNGRTLVVGRGREGWGTGMGPSLYAISPWQDGNPPANNAQLNYTTLLEYGDTMSQAIDLYNSVDTDFYHEGAWLTNDDNSAVMLLGTRSFGTTWYEHAHFAGHRRHVMVLFNPDDFADVIQGHKQSYEPQPYALLDLTDYLYGEQYNDRINSHGYLTYMARVNSFLRGAAYDRERNIIYVCEYNVLGIRHDQPIIHVFKINPSSSTTPDSGNIFTKPELFFSDLISGPKTGNSDGAGGLTKNDHGAIVTIWGCNLGSSKNDSKVYFSDSTGTKIEAAHVYYWTDATGSGEGGPSDLYTYHKMQEIAFSIPSEVEDGNGKISVEVKGQLSNELDFNVRNGNIYFIKNNGNNTAGDGTWLKPWQTIDYAGSGADGAVQAGDIIYIEDGVVETEGAVIRISGTKTHPISLVAYPGADVTITGEYAGASILNFYSREEYWNFSKLIVNTKRHGISPFRDIRIVGVEITGPDADGYGGAFGGNDSGGDGMSGGGKYFGVYIHDFGNDNTSAFHHTTYMSNRDGLPNNSFEIAWCYLRDNKAIHGFHIYDQTPGGDWTGVIRIHHNVVVNQKGPAVNLMSGGSIITVPLDIYNNVFINTGLGPDTGPGFMDAEIISPPKCAISLTEGIITSHVNIYNNVIYGYGDEGSGTAIHKNFGGTVDIKNNIIIDNKNLSYVNFTPDENSNNLFYSLANPNLEAPSWAAESITSDPLFKDADNNDFRLQKNSPAINAGSNLVANVVDNDFNGNFRPQGDAFDIGVHEYISTELINVLISSQTISEGNVNKIYSQILSATGGTKPYSWSITSGKLPIGLILNQNSGEISGTPLEAGTFEFIIEVHDADLKNDTQLFCLIVSQEFSDTEAPIISNGFPTGSLSSGTTATEIKISTNENAICSFAETANSDYLAMTVFETTGNLIHSATASGLQDGNSYSYYIKCQDQHANTNTLDYEINFSINKEIPDISKIDIAISDGNNDAEEFHSTGYVSTTSSDLELITAETTQTVGLRFTPINIPKGSTITNAYIQFTVDEINSEPTSLLIRAEASDNAETFLGIDFNISTRSTTTNVVMWEDIPHWTDISASDIDQRTPDISSIIQEVIDRANWNQGNALAFLITGEGKRVAVSSNQSSRLAPILHVEFENKAPIVDIEQPSTPSNLVAKVVSPSQINLSWTASTDNVGVTGYSIFRNGSEIETTANLVYSDTGLSSKTTYSYTIMAFDASGNESEQSAEITATTKSEEDPVISDAIIVDHTCTDITKIPESVIIQAKNNLHIAYGHTSHGSQLISGMNGLDNFLTNSPKFDITPGLFVWNDGPREGYLDIDDYAMKGDVGYYPQWVNNTRSYLGDHDPTTGRGTNHSDVNVIIWSWCGQVDSKYASGTLDSQYLTPMTQLEEDYPGITFVYMTGHVDHWDDANNKAANQMIRDFVMDNNKVLYDFADIESYDPDGNYYEYPHDNCDYYSAENGTLIGNWCTEWQNSHEENVDWWASGASHSNHINGNLKGYSAWWLWARLSGWQDKPKPEGDVLIVDFGASSDGNEFGLPGWKNVYLSDTVSYTSNGAEGVTFSEAAYEYDGYIIISGTERLFKPGEQIALTWHNAGSSTLSFYPLISFVDLDAPHDAEGEPQWYATNQARYVYAGNTVTTYYDITDANTAPGLEPPSQGTYSHIAISYSGGPYENLILDKVEIRTADLEPPKQVNGLKATNVLDHSITFDWDEGFDNTGVKSYRIYINGLIHGVSDENKYTAYNLDSKTEYSVFVNAVDEKGNVGQPSDSIIVTTMVFQGRQDLINPMKDLEYMGAFRLPSGDGGSWNYRGKGGSTFYPFGDPDNIHEDTDYPGSIYSFGAINYDYIAELSIPEPVISPSKNLNDLNIATNLKSFSNSCQPLNLPGRQLNTAGIEYIPATGTQNEDLLYLVWGDYYMVSNRKVPTHSACNLDLTTSGGIWFIGPEEGDPPYNTIMDYLFKVPDTWANENLAGKSLITGSIRSGNYPAGPSMHAIAPWLDQTPLPYNGTELSYITLLQYDRDSGTNHFNGFVETDYWAKGAWLTTETKSAVMFSGTKGFGRYWYGFNDGTVYDDVMHNIPSTNNSPDGNSKGGKSDRFEGMFVFYDPDDLKAVADGNMNPNQPQPYAALNIEDVLFDVNTNSPSERYNRISDVSYDRENGILYIFEPLNENSQSIVHVWKLKEQTSPEYEISLADGILVLKIISNISDVTDIPRYVDINNDNIINLDDAIYILRSISSNAN